MDFHIHEHSDELFYVIEGKLELETDSGFLEIKEKEFVVVPHNTRHRPVVTELTKFLKIELEGTLNKENSGGLFLKF